jgi:hypothetical protein
MAFNFRLLVLKKLHVLIGLLEDQSVDGKIILKWIFKKWDGGTDWIGLTQYKNKWRDLVNAVTNLRVP